MKQKVLLLMALLVSSLTTWADTTYSVAVSSFTDDASDWSLSSSSASPDATVTLTYSGSETVNFISVRSSYTNTYYINSTSDVATQVANFNANPGSRIVFNCNYTTDDAALTFTADEGEIDLNGHTVYNLYLQNNTAGKTIYAKNGTITNKLDGVSGWDVSYYGTIVLEDLTIDRLFTDGHPCYVYSGTYNQFYVTYVDGYCSVAYVYSDATVTEYPSASSGNTGTHTDVTTTVPGTVTELTGNQWSLVMPHYNTVVEVGSYSFSGTGTEADPYTISSTDDWDQLAAAVNAGNTFSGYYFKQTADITVSTMVGTYVSLPFSGTYDGDGYTITANISSTNDGAAPFVCISGATLKNFTVAGTVSGAIHCAAVVGGALGTNTISNVIATAAVTCSSSHCGGIVGHGRSSTTTMDGCVFAGSIDGGTSAVGILLGWSDKATITMTNCLEVATSITATNYNPVGLGENAISVTNTYYTHAISGSPSRSNSVGTLAYTITAADGVTMTNAGSVGVTYNEVIYAGSSEVVSLTLSSSSTGYTSTAGTLSGSGSSYTLTMDAANAFIWAGTGTESDPYLISSADDWYTMATYVNYGTSYSGYYFKQTANISVYTMMGSYGSLPFSGTYDGDGHTITAYISSSVSGAAPFVYISGATLKNFTVDGTVSGAIHCSAVVGGAAGTNIISNVIAKAAVTCSSTHCGGIVGHGLSSTTTLDGCVFAGSINGASISYIGALWGWCESTATLIMKNCLEAGTSYTATNFSPIGQFNNAPTSTITNTYYKNAASGSTTKSISGGKQAYSITGATGVTVANAGTATEYSVSGITSYGTGIKYNDVLYAGSGDAVSLTLSHVCTSSTGTLSGSSNPYTLTMEAANAVLTPSAFAATANADPAGTGYYYSSFYDGSRKYLLPDGVEAYVGTVSGTTLTLTKIAEAGEVIPAATGVILKSSSSSYTMSVSSSDAVSFSDNNLTGVDVATTISTSDYASKYIYTMAAENSTLGFYQYYTPSYTTNTTLAANKAFLVLSEEASARGFAFSFEVVTGIESLSPDPSPKGEESGYYTLSGQRVSKPTTKGLYIVNGRKIIVR